jgi:xanthine/uracil permease
MTNFHSETNDPRPPRGQKKTGGTGRMEMLYGLNDTMPKGQTLAFAFQHLVYFITSTTMLPVLAGTVLGPDQSAIAEMIQRTFFLAGLVALLQVLFGHRYPIYEGAAGLWMGILLNLASTAMAYGKEMAVLRSEIEMGMILSGAVVIALSVSGLMSKVAKVFTPIVNGTFLIVMMLQISSSIVRGMMGLDAAHQTIQGKSVFVFVLSTAVIVFLNIRGPGFLKRIATLVGVAAGWVGAVLLGIAPEIQNLSAGFFTAPAPFAWGAPAFEWSVVITCVIGNLVLFSNMMSSIIGTHSLVGDVRCFSDKRLGRSSAIYGLSAVLIGVYPTVGFVPLTSVVGAIAMSRVAARRPFVLACIFMMIMGLIAPIGAFFAALPLGVGYSAILIAFALMFSQAIYEYKKIDFDNRAGFVVGTSIIIGVGMMFLPVQAFQNLPEILKYIVSNGLIVGIILVILLEHVFLSDRIHRRIGAIRRLRARQKL